MINKKDEDYFKKELDRQNYFWGRFGGKPNFEGKTILDFGCGHGAMCMDIAKNNPKIIIINPKDSINLLITKSSKLLTIFLISINN